MSKFALIAFLSLGLVLAAGVINAQSNADPVWREPIPAEVFKGEVFKLGSTGPEVRKLQDFLKELEVFPLTVPSTGYYGQITSSAVERLVEKYKGDPRVVEFREKLMSEREKTLPVFINRLYSVFTPASVGSKPVPLGGSGMVKPLPGVPETGLAGGRGVAVPPSRETVSAILSQIDNLRLMIVNLIAQPFSSEEEINRKVKEAKEREAKLVKLSPEMNQQCKGDLNRDGKINDEDIALFKKLFNSKVSDSFSARADFNGDGVIDMVDLAAILAVYGHSVPDFCVLYQSY